MNRSPEPRKQWSVSTDMELFEMLRHLTQTTRVPTSRLLDEVIEDLLLKYNIIKEKTKTP